MRILRPFSTIRQLRSELTDYKEELADYKEELVLLRAHLSAEKARADQLSNDFVATTAELRGFKEHVREACDALIRATVSVPLAVRLRSAFAEDGKSLTDGI
jgi:hypothetical protein